MNKMAELAGAAALALIPRTRMRAAQEATAAASAIGRRESGRRRRAAHPRTKITSCRNCARSWPPPCRRGWPTGRYNVSDPSVLAERINADLAAVAHDHHLGMHSDPKQAAELAARPHGAGADDAPPTAEEIRFADRLNHGILQLKVLPGNIRYLETIGFFWGGEKTEEAYDNAMRFLKGGDAIIIDMRQNGGGSPDAVRYMISHFLEAEHADRHLLHARRKRATRGRAWARFRREAWPASRSTC